MWNLPTTARIINRCSKSFFIELFFTTWIWNKKGHCISTDIYFENICFWHLSISILLRFPSLFCLIPLPPLFLSIGIMKKTHLQLRQCIRSRNHITAFGVTSLFSLAEHIARRESKSDVLSRRQNASFINTVIRIKRVFRSRGRSDSQAREAIEGWASARIAMKGINGKCIFCNYGFEIFHSSGLPYVSSCNSCNGRRIGL